MIIIPSMGAAHVAGSDSAQAQTTDDRTTSCTYCFQYGMTSNYFSQISMTRDHVAIYDGYISM